MICSGPRREPRTNRKGLDEVPAPGTGRPAAAEAKARIPAPEAEYAQVSKAARCRWREDCRKEVLQIFFRTEYQVINVGQLEKCASDGPLDPAKLYEKRMIRRLNMPVKILGQREIKAPVTIRAHAVSASARTKIEASGGQIEIIDK